MDKGLHMILAQCFRSLCIAGCLLLSFSGIASHIMEANQLKSIDFRLNKNQDAVLLVELAFPIPVINIQKTPQGLTIELFKTNVMEELISVFDVTDFATAVERVEVFRQELSTLLQVTIQGPFTYSHVWREHYLEIIISVVKEQTQPQATLITKQEQLISINFQDISVRSILQLMADYNQFNLVVSDSVQGNLTLRLDEVSWQKALDIILQVKGLDKRIDGNVILVAPQSELALHEKQRLAQAQLAETWSDLQSEIIPIHFAKASDIAEMIGGTPSVSMLSERGMIRIDERTNTLLIRELPNNLNIIREMIKLLDIPVKQVQIEARIVTVNEGNLDELGIRWGVSSSHGQHTIGGSIEGNLTHIGLYEPENSADMINNFLNVNLGATSANASSIAFQVAKLGSGTLLDLELSAMQRESKAEVISSPRLITTNKQPAYIEQGTEIPYLESSSSGATTVAFRKAVLSLKVTPQITPDDRLVLDLSVTQDRPGEIVKTGTGEAVAINTQRIGTQVLVNNGETIVLGGIFQHSTINTIDKVPLLGDLPLLRTLFRRSYQQLGKSELLIFVTPNVVIQ